MVLSAVHAIEETANRAGYETFVANTHTIRFSSVDASICCSAAT
ncbi:MAG: hypothetical protein U5N21_03725 [Rhodococcus sp. (in: high G+C Gram-positive bacteria)]|nr:hypothetical protein [Rhodococcus sp. (in: high G+C Gram-positive bacteria)]